MRVRAALLVLLAVGTALAATVLLADRPLSPAQRDKVRTVCPECHGEVPAYDRVQNVHTKHAAFECSFCHHDPRGLKTTDRLHAHLERAGLGAALLALLGMVANMAVIRKKR